MNDELAYLDALGLAPLVTLSPPLTATAVVPTVPGWSCSDGQWTWNLADDEKILHHWVGDPPDDPWRAGESSHVFSPTKSGPCAGEAIELQLPFRRIRIGLPQQSPIVLDADADFSSMISWSPGPASKPTLNLVGAGLPASGLLPESFEFLRALAALDEGIQRAPANAVALAPEPVDLAAFDGQATEALTLEQARRVWIWRLAQAVYVDRFELFGPAVLTSLQPDDFHLLLDERYAAWRHAWQAGGTPATDPPRDLVPVSWYPTSVVGAQWNNAPQRWVSPPDQLGATYFSWRIDGACAKSQRPSGQVAWSCKTLAEDCVAQPGAQFFWRTSHSEVVQAFNGRSDQAAPAAVQVHTGSLWDTNPLANLVEAMAAWRRLLERLDGRDPDLAPVDGVHPPAPYGVPTVSEALTGGNQPSGAVGTSQARRARAATLHVLELSLRKFQALPGVTLGASPNATIEPATPLPLPGWQPTDPSRDHLPSPGQTPNVAEFCRTLQAGNSDTTARLHLALLLLRTMNVPARIDMRPRTDRTGVDVLVDSVQVGGQTVPLPSGQFPLVPCTEPRGVAAGPMLQLPTLGRTFDWNAFAGNTEPWASLADPLSAAQPSDLMWTSQTIATMLLRGELNLQQVLQLQSGGLLQTMTEATMRALAIGLFAFGGVRHVWMLDRIKERWGEWAASFDPTTQTAPPWLRPLWLHRAFEVRARPVNAQGQPMQAKGWALWNSFTLPAGQQMAWAGWPVLDGTSMVDVPAMTLESGVYWAQGVAVWQSQVVEANKNDTDTPLPPAKHGTIMKSIDVEWIEDGLLSDLAIGVFASRI